MLRDLVLSFIKVHILHHAALEPVYGAALMEELKRHGYEVSPGTLYPILHNLKNEGFVTCQEKLVRGKIRKYYRITPAGQEVLREARAKMRELVGEIVDGQGPATLPEVED